MKDSSLFHLMENALQKILLYWNTSNHIKTLIKASFSGFFGNMCGTCDNDWSSINISFITIASTILTFIFRIFQSNLSFIIVFVNLQYLLASFVAIHDWHVEVQNDCIVMYRFFSNRLFVQLVPVIVKLQHVVLNFSNGKVTIYCGNNFNISLTL